MAMPEQSAPSDAAATTGTIIHRKAAAGRAEHQARAMSLSKALRLTFAKVADKMLDMSVGVIGVRRELVSRDALDTSLEMDGLRMVLDGPDRVRAALILNGDLVGALIQQQTMGKVIPETSETPRNLTTTDAAICAPFFEQVLSQAAGMPENPEDRQIITGYRFGVFVENARLLGMALEAQEYHVIHIDLDLAGGVRQGQLMLCMPKFDEAPLNVDIAADEPAQLAIAGPASPQLSETVLNLEAEVRISLAQARISLRHLGQLEAGSMLDLVQARFDNVGIQTIEGRTVARGVLGQLDGLRAVQVKSAQVAAQAGDFTTAIGSASEDQLALGADLDGFADDDALTQDAMPDLPDMPAMAGLEETVDVPDLPDLPDLTDLPDLPDMSDLESLPDLPELD